MKVWIVIVPCDWTCFAEIYVKEEERKKREAEEAERRKKEKEEEERRAKEEAEKEGEKNGEVQEGEKNGEVQDGEKNGEVQENGKTEESGEEKTDGETEKTVELEDVVSKGKDGETEPLSGLGLLLFLNTKMVGCLKSVMMEDQDPLICLVNTVLQMAWRHKEPGHQQPWYWPSFLLICCTSNRTMSFT